MDLDMAQLADILVDYCEYDLEGKHFTDRSPTDNAQEIIRCMVFTLVNSQDAREIFSRMVRDGREELELRYREDEDR